MIESPPIKKLIVDYFIEHSQEDIGKMAAAIHAHLSRGFVANETVYIKETGGFGRITRVQGHRYVLATQPGNRGHEESFHFTQLERRTELFADEIRGYILGITMETPFGRVLKENAFRSIKDSGEVARCKVPQSQCSGASCPPSKPHTLGAVSAVPRAQDARRHGRRKAEEPAVGSEEPERIPKRREPREREMVGGAGIRSILGLETRKTLDLEGFGSDDIGSLMKVFSALTNFHLVFGIEQVSVEELARSIMDPAYGSDLICKVHMRLVAMLREEIDSVGMEAFVEDAQPCVMVAEGGMCKTLDGECDEAKGMEDTGSCSKERQEEAWKQALTSLVSDISNELEMDLSYFARCVSARSRPLDRDEANNRVVLLELLLNIFFTTSVFREKLSGSMRDLRELEKRKKELQTRLRKIKSSSGQEIGGAESIEEQRKGVEKELKNTVSRILELPMQVVMGTVDGISFLNLGRRIYAAEESSYYRLSRDSLFELCKKYNPRSKSEKSILLSISQHAEVLQG